ncbi:MAG: hypothetical protein KJ709_05730 [Nanoarchaeota archaeon]|nr:hypothetical protein [Nanoarchaeota archaeon]
MTRVYHFDYFPCLHLGDIGQLRRRLEQLDSIEYESGLCASSSLEIEERLQEADVFLVHSWGDCKSRVLQEYAQKFPDVRIGILYGQQKELEESRGVTWLKYSDTEGIVKFILGP